MVGDQRRGGGRQGVGQDLLAGVVQWDRLVEADLEAEVARAAADLGTGRRRCSGIVVEEHVGPVVGAVGGAVEDGAEDRRLASVREDPADLPPATDRALVEALLVDAGPDRDDEEVVGLDPPGRGGPLQRLGDRCDRRVVGEDAAVDERTAVELVRGEVGRGG